MCACVFTCVHVYTLVQSHVWLYVFLRASVSLYVHVCATWHVRGLFMYVCVRVRLQMVLSLHVCVCVHPCPYTRVCARVGVSPAPLLYTHVPTLRTRVAACPSACANRGGTSPGEGGARRVPLPAEAPPAPWDPPAQSPAPPPMTWLKGTEPLPRGRPTPEMPHT